MNTIRTVLLCCIAAALTLTGKAQTVPQMINYQGKLTDGTGVPLRTADYVLTFSVYDIDNTQSVTPVWGP